MKEKISRSNSNKDHFPSGQALPKNPLLATPIEDPLAARVLQGSTRELARATRPIFMANEKSPVEWSAEDWARLATEREDLFDMAAVEAQFDRERFMLEGYAVFKEVMTDKATAAWMAAVQWGQRLNDTLLQSDWSQIDWHALGREPPTKELTEEEIKGALGGSQKVPQQTDEAGVKTLRQHSVFAEYFPAGHVAFLMGVLIHPQMLQLQRMCLGCEDIYLDHNQLLTRPGGYPGGSWHTHKIGAGRDQGMVTSLKEYQAQPNTNLTLCYPQGFEAEQDGGLKLIRGSHLYRAPDGCSGADDKEMEQGWLQGKRHPISGEPLVIEHLELPPGSVVCCWSHAAHGVSPKAPEKKTRWCSLLCYKKADDLSGHVLPPHSLPPVWAMKAQRGELPPVLTKLLRPSFDRALTGGRTGPMDP